MGVRLVFVAAAAAAAALSAAACGAAIDFGVKPDGSAILSISAEVPEALEAKIRGLTSSTGGGQAFGTGATGQKTVQPPLFAQAAIDAAVKARGLAVRESAVPSPRSYKGAFASAELERTLAGDPALAGIVSYEKGPGWGSIKFTVDRGNAAAIAAMFPGIDPELLEALQPPAIYDNPVTEAEYRSMLTALLGKTAAGALDGLSIKLVFSVPGPIVEAAGFSAAPGSRAASYSMSALSAMVLETPITLSLKWRQ